MKARRAHNFPVIPHALLSISMPCDEGYMVIFDDRRVYVIKDGLILLHGMRDLKKNIYIVNISIPVHTIQPKLNIKHMQNSGGIKKFANNAYEIKIKKT